MSKLLQLNYYPDPFLRKKAKEINPRSIDVMQEFIDDMVLTMKEKDGVGLAAPQVGQSIRLIVIAYKDGPFVLINPELSNFSFRKNIAEEGCLSIPGVNGTVKRNNKVTFRGLDRNGRAIQGVAEGFFARVLQHEVDHLDGILFIDRVQEITHGKIAEEKV